MTLSAVDSLAPVVLLIGAGVFAGRMRWISPASMRDLSNLVFLVLLPALLVRTMSQVHLTQLDFGPVGIYFCAAALVYFASFAIYGANRRAAVLALSGTFSNIVMIGVPLIGLAFGAGGQVLLLTLVSLHSLVLLTTATLVLEAAVAHEDSLQDAASHGPWQRWKLVLLVVRNSIIHPVPLPILAGLALGLTGWSLPVLVDRPLQLLGSAFGPVALVLVGVTLAQTAVGSHWRGALGLAMVKTVVHPAVMLVFGLAFGLRGPTLSIMVVAASMPIGANVFLFSQRYAVAQELITSAVAISTVVALISLPLVLAVLDWVA